MAILLTILKVIGIILLVLLGIILLVLFLVLFTPISYRLSAVHNEDQTKANVKVGFLFIKALAGYEKGVGLDYSVKALFFKVFPRSGKEEDLSDEDEFDALEEYLEQQDQVDSQTDSQIEHQINSQDDILDSPDFESDIKPDTENAGFIDQSLDSNTPGVDLSKPENTDAGIEDSVLEENVPEEKLDNQDALQEETSEQIPEEKIDMKTKIGNTLDKASDKYYELTDKADKKLDEADRKYNQLMTKMDHLMQFLDREYVQRTLKRFLKVMKRLFGTVKPKKSKGYVHYGLNSSADTGMVLGKVSAFYPLYGRWLTIEPDFYNKVIEGDIDVKGRIYLFRVVFPVLGIALTRDFWRTFKLAKKI